MRWPLINSVRRFSKLMNKEKIKAAQSFQQQGDWSSALAIYQELLTENPDNPDILHQIGIIYAQQQNYPHALEYIQQALKFQPDSAPFHNSKGNVLLRQGDLEGALSEY